MLNSMHVRHTSIEILSISSSLYWIFDINETILNIEISTWFVKSNSRWINFESNTTISQQRFNILQFLNSTKKQKCLSSCNEWLDIKKKTVEMNELNQYLLKFKIRDLENIIVYWKNQNERFFKFTRMIMNVFSIFNMFAKFERVFSKIKHTIIDEKTKFKSRFIETLKCCKFWFRTKIFIENSINAIMTKKFEKQLLKQMKTTKTTKKKKITRMHAYQAKHQENYTFYRCALVQCSF